MSRSREEVWGRARALDLLVLRANIERDRETDPQDQRDGWRAILAARDRVELTSAEQALLNRPVGFWNEADVVDVSWRVESLAVLTWALGLTELAEGPTLRSALGLVVSLDQLNAPADAQLRPSTRLDALASTLTPIDASEAKWSLAYERRWALDWLRGEVTWEGARPQPRKRSSRKAKERRAPDPIQQPITRADRAASAMGLLEATAAGGGLLKRAIDQLVRDGAALDAARPTAPALLQELSDGMAASRAEHAFDALLAEAATLPPSSITAALDRMLRLARFDAAHRLVVARGEPVAREFPYWTFDAWAEQHTGPRLAILMTMEAAHPLIFRDQLERGDDGVLATWERVRASPGPFDHSTVRPGELLWPPEAMLRETARLGRSALTHTWLDEVAPALSDAGRSGLIARVARSATLGGHPDLARELGTRNDVEPLAQAAVLRDAVIASELLEWQGHPPLDLLHARHSHASERERFALGRLLIDLELYDALAGWLVTMREPWPRGEALVRQAIELAARRAQWVRAEQLAERVHQGVDRVAFHAAVVGDLAVVDRLIPRCDAELTRGLAPLVAMYRGGSFEPKEARRKERPFWLVFGLEAERGRSPALDVASWTYELLWHPPALGVEFA